jgi:drug/metabolite transporter (DMT)-like permease
MGYLFVALAILSGGIKAFCGKKISGQTPTVKNAVLTNFVRMLFCVVFGFFFVLLIDGFSAFKMDGKVFLLALGGSVATCLFLVSWLLAMRRSAYMTVEAFVLSSMFVPIVCNLLCYGNAIKLSQIIGLAVLVLAVVVMSMYDNQVKGKFTWGVLGLLLVVALSNGANSFTQNVFKIDFGVFSAAAFNFYLYVFSAAILGVTYLCIPQKAEENTQTKEKTPLFDKTKLTYIAIMAFCLFCNSYFITLANGYLLPVMLNPLINVLALLVGLLISVAFFKEKLKPISVIGVLLMLVGIIFINVLNF